jgi:hypothetical protein
MNNSTVVKPAKPRTPPNAGKGRVKGVPNKTTKLIKEAFAEAFDKLGGADALVTWGRENQTEFYKLASKLIPIQAEHSGPDGSPMQVTWLPSAE